MPKIPLPGIVDRNVDESVLSDGTGALIRNAYVDVIDGRPIIRKRPGLRASTNLGTGAAVDGLYWWDKKSVALAATGGNVHKITSQDGNSEDVTGDALSVVTHASFTDNGPLAIIASGGRMLTYDNSNPTAFMADADAPTTVPKVAYLDGYILALEQNTARFHFPLDPTDILDWSALGFATASSKPDDLLSIKTGWDEINLFGKESLEIWVNDGATPFSKLPGAYIEQGCIAAHSVALAGTTWVWLNHERRIVALTGRTPEIISAAYDDVIRDINAVSDAYSDFISIGKHAFYLISFPSVDKTFVYDFTTGAWMEWGYWDSTNAKDKLWLGRSYAYARRWEQHLIGSREDSAVYQLDPDTYQDAGNEIRTVIRTGQISHGTANRKRSTVLRITVKRGLGSEAGSEPVFTLRWRDESGPWGNELQLPLGKIGETESVLQLNRLGIYRKRQYEITHSDYTDFQLAEIEEEVEVIE